MKTVSQSFHDSRMTIIVIIVYTIPTIYIVENVLFNFSIFHVHARSGQLLFVVIITMLFYLEVKLQKFFHSI